MKRHIALLASLLLLSGAAAVAQEYVPTPVTISSEKVKFNGKVYYAHPVLERQTLFSISKAYGVTENDLYEANPSLRETGLQKGTILLIPMKQKEEDKASRKEPAAQAQPQPQAQAQAQAQEKLREQEPQAEYREHVVRWYEDLEDIARRYNMSVQEIMDYNNLKSRKLTTRQVLRIPNPGAKAPAVARGAGGGGRDGDRGNRSRAARRGSGAPAGRGRHLLCGSAQRCSGLYPAPSPQSR